VLTWANMREWIGKNLTAVIAFSAAIFYFFGALATGVRNSILHTLPLAAAPAYADLALVGFHPLFAYFIVFFPPLSAIYFDLVVRASSVERNIEDRKAPTRSFWASVRANKLHLVIVLCLAFESFLSISIVNGLYENPDLILHPQSADLRVFGFKSGMPGFRSWGLVCMLLALATPVALAFSYSREHKKELRLLSPPEVQFQNGIALCFFAALIALLYYSAEFRGFFAASKAPEAFLDRAEFPDLRGKRLFLLGQNESLYALLTSQQPGDTRAIIFVRKEKIPVLTLGRSVAVLQPIR
ncbi:MAG: hypothetical protein M3Y72_08515, partial [Acidobacteriota bacterium]|nr:hypothetical protein [Acidobacteriota bacterium]